MSDFHCLACLLHRLGLNLSSKGTLVVSPEQLVNEGAHRRVSRSECSVCCPDELGKAESYASICIARILTGEVDVNGANRAEAASCRRIFMTKERHLHLGDQFDDALCEHEKMNRPSCRVFQINGYPQSKSATVGH